MDIDLSNYSKTKVNPVYIPNSKILFVGEAPGKEEDIKGEPFIGESGKILRECAKKVGINMQKVSITNTVPYRPFKNATPSKSIIEYFKPDLIKFIKKVNPNIVIALGSSASYALSKKQNILSVKGTLEYSKELNCKIGYTIHPALIIKTPEYVHSFLLELYKFKKESKTKKYTPDDREINIKVCYTLNDLTEMMNVIKEKKVISIDTETSGLNPLIDK